MRRIAFLLVFLMAAPAVMAGDPAGTEVDPELTDTTGDVEYGPTYIGAKDHAYMDVVSAWYEYNATTDIVVATFKMADLTRLENPPQDWGIILQLRSDGSVDGERMGTFRFTWQLRGQGQGNTENVTFSQTSVGGTFVPIPHAFEVRFGAPGYVIFYVDRERLHKFADTLRTHEVESHEVQWSPGGVTSLAFTQDTSRGEREYNLNELRRAASNATDGESLPSSTHSMTTEPETHEGTMAIGIIATAAVLAAVAWRRNSRGR